MKKTIVILSGGNSDESEISRVTSIEIQKALNNNYQTILVNPVDFSSISKMVNKIKEIMPFIVFNGLHGAEGENGSIQAALSLENIYFTGSGSKSSAIAMDKFLSGKLVKSIGIPVPKQVFLTNLNLDWSKLEDLNFPIVVKPNDSGSSVGISIVKEREKLAEAIEDAFKFSKNVICENYISGRELTVTILGDEALPVVEIIPKNGWYDFVNKYTKGTTIYEVPAKLSTQEMSEIQQKALQIFKLFKCSVYARIDFRFDGTSFYFLEVNTLPGMTPLSLTPMAVKKSGLNFNELLEKIIRLSMGKYEK
ncbi:MAG: D-alanine--D-alanine ligase [Candidatus Cloacimonetes bacterium]|jgi:D-alanine-D-alanine ligase|nr:D-alanine--D-alanine ligase [Candidatus Cloacimonadota bacterium]MBT6994441.1 D-alanine--D-alanine ligase [Candidatus Cloacimonadota bacterium]MBT7469013.1 D-alanine--D-alanine ligase [Candidatus Cloacimonadota bacterium]